MRKRRNLGVPKVITEFFLDDFRRDGSVIFVPYSCGEKRETRAIPIHLGRAAALKFLELAGPEAMREAVKLVGAGKH